MASERQLRYGGSANLGVSIVVIDNKMPKIISQLQPAAEALALKFLERVYEVSQDLVPILTGNLKESGHIYHEPRAVVLSYNALNNIGITYAAYVEYGTYKTPAQPYVNPAVSKAMPIFQQGLSGQLG